MDAKIVSHFRNTILTVNEKGKRKVAEETLFFMPHCSFDLYDYDRVTNRYNSLLWSNWGSTVKMVTIIGNSFSRYESTILNEEKRKHPSNCIFRLLAYFEDIPIMESTYKDDKLRYLFDSFHSTSIMYIPESKEIEWDTRPEEPECGDDVVSTVNEGILRYVTEKCSKSLSDESICP